MKKYLIVPGNSPEALLYTAKLRLKNKSIEIHSANSLSIDSTSIHYEKKIRIPWITEKNFESHFIKITEKEKYDNIVCFQNGLYKKISKISKSNTCEALSTDADSEIYEQIKERSKGHHRFIGKHIKKELLPPLINQFNNIKGNCSEEKLCGIMKIASEVDRGDVVEIGSYFGKSAFLLGWIAKNLTKGNLLCIDPWDEQTIHDTANAHSLLKSTDFKINKSSIKERFIRNLIPFYYGNMNYIQATSLEAEKKYSANQTVKSNEFGETVYKKKISLLHIDGNHDYKYVKEDIKTWGKHLKKNAWIIFDDYFWCYGNGPKKAADEFIEKNQIKKAFVCGNAMFIQKG